jgi:proline iminopeptidase
MKYEKTFSRLEELNINHSTQWVLVRGKNQNAPLLIHVQQGPGLPMISEANEMERKLHLENHFLVAYWDQRGCGKSFSKDIPPETINLAQMADDIIACTRYLLKKYNRDKAVIAGYSIGATSAILAAAKENSIFSALYLTGIDIDIPFANQYVLDYAMKKAVAGKNKKLIHKINQLKEQPIVETERFQQRAEIITNLGGIKAGSSFNQLMMSSVKNILFSKYYGIGGLVKTLKGMAFCQNALMHEMNQLNLFQQVKTLDVPVHFIQGQLDAIAPPEKGREYFEFLQAEHKSFTLFENSAHMPQYDEPEKFSNLILSFLNN